MLGLPALDIFEGRAAKAAGPAAAPTKKIYSAMMIQQNGAVQGHGGDPDMFWPRALGPIDANAMATTDADRTTSELKDYASKLIFVRGLNFHYSNNHGGGNVAALSGSPVMGGGDTSMVPVGPSIDFFIANSLTPGTDPLTLYAGKKGTYRDDALSFGLGGKLRIGDNNPWNVYNRVMGLAAADPATIMKLAVKRKSINDLIRADLQSLLARTDLSQADRSRIDLHLTSVRDLEVGMTATIGGPPLDTAGMQMVNGTHTTDANMETVVGFQMDLIAFAFASDRVRTATLQVGGCNDHTQYTVNGVQYPPYHFISHHVMSDGDNGTPIANAVNLLHEIDKIHARYFKRLLDRLAAYTLPQGGTLLDSSVNLWVNSISDGPPHSGSNIPHVLAGGAGGFLKTGTHLMTSGYTSKVLNTIVSACGVRTAAGGLVDNFGDPQGTGLITEVVA
jgi:hypothetical protein